MIIIRGLLEPQFYSRYFHILLELYENFIPSLSGKLVRKGRISLHRLFHLISCFIGKDPVIAKHFYSTLTNNQNNHAHTFCKFFQPASLNQTKTVSQKGGHASLRYSKALKASFANVQNRNARIVEMSTTGIWL